VLKILAVEPSNGTGPPGTILDDGFLVACGGGGALRLKRVQLAGRAATDADAFLRGHPIPIGTPLGA
jgi:methionyl-tRNA formyltransferase